MRTILAACVLALLAPACDDSGSNGDADAESRDAGETTDSGDDRDGSAADRSLDAEADGSIDASSFDAEPSDAADGGEPIGSLLVFVGSGEWGATSGMITSHRFDPEQSALVHTATIAAGDLASYLAFDPIRGIVHVADEGGGRVLSFEIIDDDGRLRPLDERAASGHPVHVTLSTAGDRLLVAHYNEGTTEVFGVQANGAVDDASDLVSSGAQSHSVWLSADDAFALVPAKDADWIAQYRFDDAAGTLAENTPPRLPTAQGAGPRHLAFHPDGLHAYVINELDNTVDAYDFDPAAGTLALLQTISALPAGFSGQSTGADIHLHPNGRFLYASLRPIGMQGLIAIFSIDAAGMLSPIGHEQTRGEIPRNFTLTPDGSHLLAANQFSANVAIFTVDPNSGQLGFVRTEEVAAQPFFVGVVSR